MDSASDDSTEVQAQPGQLKSGATTPGDGYSSDEDKSPTRPGSFLRSVKDKLKNRGEKEKRSGTTGADNAGASAAAPRPPPGFSGPPVHAPPGTAQYAQLHPPRPAKMVQIVSLYLERQFGQIENGDPNSDLVPTRLLPLDIAQTPHITTADCVMTQIWRDATLQLIRNGSMTHGELVNAYNLLGLAPIYADKDPNASAMWQDSEAFMDSPAPPWSPIEPRAEENPGSTEPLPPGTDLHDNADDQLRNKLAATQEKMRRLEIALAAERDRVQVGHRRQQELQGEAGQAIIYKEQRDQYKGERDEFQDRLDQFNRFEDDGQFYGSGAARFSSNPRHPRNTRQACYDARRARRDSYDSQQEERSRPGARAQAEHGRRSPSASPDREEPPSPWRPRPYREQTRSASRDARSQSSRRSSPDSRSTSRHRHEGSSRSHRRSSSGPRVTFDPRGSLRDDQFHHLHDARPDADERRRLREDRRREEEERERRPYLKTHESKALDSALFTATRLFKKAEKNSKIPDFPADTVVKMVNRATELYIELEAQFGARLETDKQKKDYDYLSRLVVKLGAYTPRARGERAKAPQWDGQSATLGRHLDRIDKVCRTFHEDDSKLSWLESSLNRSSKKAISHCKTYEAARDILYQMATNSESIIANCRNQLTSLPIPSTLAEEEANLARAVNILGMANSADPKFRLTCDDATRAFQLFLKDGRSIHLGRLQDIKREAEYNQGTDMPNVAVPVREYINYIRNEARRYNAVMAADPRVEANVVSARPVALNPGEGSGRRHAQGKPAPKAAAQHTREPKPRSANGQFTKENNKKCIFCFTHSHSEHQYYNCVAICSLAKDKKPVPKDMCKSCLKLPAGPGCANDHCCSELSSSGRPLDYRCQRCGIHRLIGTCTRCLGIAEKTKARLSKKGSETNVRAVHVIPATTTVNRVVANNAVLGSTITPTEVVKVAVKNGKVVNAVLLYDSQAESTLFSPSLMQICETRVEYEPLTVCGVGAKTKHDTTTIATAHILGRGQKYKIDGIALIHPPAKPKFWQVPEEWQRVKRERRFAKQVAEVPTQHTILVGIDFKYPPVHVAKHRVPVMINGLRLMRSHLTGLLMGSGIPPGSYYPDATNTNKTKPPKPIVYLNAASLDDYQGDIPDLDDDFVISDDDATPEPESQKRKLDRDREPVITSTVSRKACKREPGSYWEPGSYCRNCVIAQAPCAAHAPYPDHAQPRPMPGHHDLVHDFTQPIHGFTEDVHDFSGPIDGINNRFTEITASS
jgi:hypothetical protein